MRHFLPRSSSFAALLALAVTPIWAQDAAVSAEAEASVEAEATGKAPPAIPEITVTAQKRAEDVQDVPLSVTAVAGDLLEARAVDKVDDIGYLAPNLDIAALPRSSYIRIRGLGSGDNKGFEQSIGLFVDGIYYGRAEYLNDAMIDIERIEVLRGPQGTLFGKNTVAGALNITTRDPSTEWEAYASALFGEYDQQRFEGAINIPFWPDVAGLRIAAKDNTRDGYIHNRVLNRDEANLDKTYARAKLGLLGTERFELVLGVDYGSLEARGNGYQDPESVWLRAGVSPSVLERLAEADAFIGMGLTRRDALWQVRAIRAPKPLPLFSDPMDGEGIHEPDMHLPGMHLGEEVVEDYVALRLTLRAHPMELLRPSIPGLTPHDRLPTAPLRRTTVCGLVITRQRPGTASGVIFLTLEDETGVSNVVVWPKVYERFRRSVMGGRLLRVTGHLEREGIVVHLIADHIEDLSRKLSELGHPLDDAIGLTQPQADDAPRPRQKPTARHPREQAKRLFPSRDFH